MTYYVPNTYTYTQNVLNTPSLYSTTTSTSTPTYYYPTYSVTSDYTSPYSQVTYSVTSSYNYDPYTTTYYGINTNSPLVPSINYSYSQPAAGFYENINMNPETQKKITKYVQMKALDKWLPGDMIDILNYFKVDSNGKVDVIDNLNDYRPIASTNDTKQILEKKIDFIEEFFLTPRIVRKILEKFIKKTGIEWIKIPKNSFYVKEVIANKLKNMIKESIEVKSKRNQKGGCPCSRNQKGGCPCSKGY